MKKIAIIGGGISGLSIAYFLDRLANVKAKKISIDLIEKNSDFAEDKISKFQYGQDIYDKGWHNAISDKGILFQIMLELGLYRYLIKSKKINKFIYTKDGLKTIPEKMLYGYPLSKIELLQSDIFSLKDKFSILFNLHKKSKIKDISRINVEDFFLNKINAQVYHKITEPLLTNFFGSDVSKQSFSFLLPDLAFADIKNADTQENVSQMFDNKVTDNIMHGNEYRLKFTLASFLENLESNFSNKVFIDFEKNVESIRKEKNKYVLVIQGKDYYYDYVVVSVKHKEFLNWFLEDRRLHRYYKDLNFVSNIVLTIVVDKDTHQISPELGEIVYANDLDNNIDAIEYVSNKWSDIRGNNLHLIRVYVNREKKVKKLLTQSDEKISEIILSELETIHGKMNYEKLYVNKIVDNYMFTDTKYSKYIHEIGEYLSLTYDKMYFIGNSKKAINLETSILEARDVAKNIIERL